MDRAAARCTDLRVQNNFMDLASSYNTLKDYAEAKGLGIGECQRQLHRQLAAQIRQGKDPLAGTDPESP